jgi:hypothetical protein
VEIKVRCIELHFMFSNCEGLTQFDNLFSSGEELWI